MNSLWIILIVFFIYVLAYIFYGDFISKKLFCIKKNTLVPSKEFKNDIDYVSTDKKILFGHHFASIAGTGPIVGPAIAVIWGWLPALLWLVFASIFAGAVHDYASLIISVRNKGASIGEISAIIINARVRKLFLIVIFFSLWIVIAIFGMVIAIIFSMYPSSVLSVWIQIPVSVFVGFFAYKKKWNITLLAIIGVVIMYISIFLGIKFPFNMPSVFGLNPMTVWIFLLFVYAYIASVLPIWSLLQPRDYINSYQLIIGIILIVLSIFVSNPKIVAPIIQISPKAAPPIIPFLFITIACGAISGFHAMVSSGTSSKQIKSEKDVKLVGYGAMITESFLGVLVLIAVSAGIGLYVKNNQGVVLNGISAWQYHYSSWFVAKGLTSKITAFVNGSANMLEFIGITRFYGQAIIGVLIASFAGTTLDTATRIQRYIITEISLEYNVKALKNRYISTFFAVFFAAVLAFFQKEGKGALMLWPLFGVTNQILAGMVFLVIYVYLSKNNKNTIPIIIPMVFMLFVSMWAMCVNLISFYNSNKFYLFIIGIVILLFQIWMIFESFICLKKKIK